MSLVIKTIILLNILLLAACSKNKNPEITIAINPWPGYEFLYLAEQKGFFKEEGLNISLVQVGSLSDAQRAYMNGFVDGMASTIIEVVQAQAMGSKPLAIVLIADYSDGGDVILSRKGYTDMQSLKGKTIGCEVSSLGIFVLQRALAKVGMSMSDVNVINVEQGDGKEFLDNGKIDAFVSYAPYSLEILASPNYHKIFTSAEIPNEIIDTVSIAKDILNESPELIEKLHRAWDKAIAYFESNKEESIKLMAEREGVSTGEFEDILADLKTIRGDEQNTLLGNAEKLNAITMDVCQTMVGMSALKADCASLPDVLFQRN